MKADKAIFLFLVFVVSISFYVFIVSRLEAKRISQETRGKVTQRGTLILENCRDGFCYDVSGAVIKRDAQPFVLSSPVAENVK